MAIFIDEKAIDERYKLLKERPQERRGVAILNKLRELTIGAGDTIFKASKKGIWLGNKNFADAPFRVDMDGNVVGNSATFSQYLHKTNDDLDDVPYAGTTLYSKIDSNLPSDENLAGYWSFDEGAGSVANDGSGNGNDGTLHNMEAADWVDGPAGGALSFDGSAEYMDINATIIPTGDFSIVVWVYLNNLTSYQAIVGQTDEASAGRLQFLVEQTTGKLFLQITSVITSTGTVAASGWHQIGVTRSGSDVTFYIDGAAAGTGTLADNVLQVDTLIGKSGSNYMDGKIDEPRIYSSVLTAKEIYALYKNPSGQKGAMAVQLGSITTGSIYSGLFSTSTAGATNQRVVLSTVDDTLRFYDSGNNQVIGIGDSATQWLNINLNTTNDIIGVSILSAVATTEPLISAVIQSASATSKCISVSNSGSGYSIYSIRANAGKSLVLTQANMTDPIAYLETVAGTNGVLDMIEIYRLSGGASAQGSGVIFTGRDSAFNKEEIGNIDFAFTSNTSGSEATKAEIGLLGSTKLRITSDGKIDLTATSRVSGDPTTDGYFIIKISGVNYKVPCLAA